jgi:hypothetical protein
MDTTHINLFEINVRRRFSLTSPFVVPMSPVIAPAFDLPTLITITIIHNGTGMITTTGTDLDELAQRGGGLL